MTFYLLWYFPNIVIFTQNQKGVVQEITHRT